MGDLAAATRLDGTGRLLDVGCGTVQLAIPLAGWFERVVGLDVSGEMLAEAERQAALAGVVNIRWLELAGEAISPALGRFRLVTIGSALHWMQRDEVLARCHEVLAQGGALAIFSNGGSFWNGTLAWQQAVVAVVQRWLGPERRAGQGSCACATPGPSPPSPGSSMPRRGAGAPTSATERRPSRPTWPGRCWRSSRPTASSRRSPSTTSSAGA
jgi:SAM-dependent methyltransferase